MSNTDGEIIELREELQRTKLLLQNCNGDIVRADRELASLREQLETNRKLRAELEDELSEEREYSKQKENEVKEKEEVIMELIPIAEEYRTNLVFGPLRKDKREKTTGIKAIIDKAKSLTTKDK